MLTNEGNEKVNKALVCTHAFKMSASNFMSTFLFRYAWLWLLSLSALGVAGLVIGITVDIRWLILGLMLIFIVIPLVATFIYYYFALKPECYVNTTCHTLEFDENGITATLIFDEDKNRELKFDYCRFKNVEINADSYLLLFKAPDKGYIWIPKTAFESDEQYFDSIDYLHSRLETPHLISQPN